MSAPVLQIRHVAKAYPKGGGGEAVAVQGIDFDIHAGEFICLLGPSGCGKSTVLNMIAGFDWPTRGEIVLHGKPISGPGTDRTMIFQDVRGSLFSWLNVRDNVEFGLRMAHMPKAQRREISSRYLDLVGLTKAIDLMPHELSGGMKQRVQIARALANDPEILLMDEPFGALDAQTRGNLQGQLEQIWSRTGKTIVFVTHDVGESVRLADRIVVMSRGPAARIMSIIENDLSRPRSLGSPDAGAMHERITALIQDAIPEDHELRDLA